MKLLKLLVSFAVLLAFFAVGEGIAWLTGLPLPGAVLGMVLLSTCLVTGLVDVAHVEASADLLLSYLGLLFVPPAVAVMLYFDLIARDWLALSVGTLFSLLAVLWSTALSAKFLLRRGEGRDA